MTDRFTISHVRRRINGGRWVDEWRVLDRDGPSGVRAAPTVGRVPLRTVATYRSRHRAALCVQRLLDGRQLPPVPHGHRSPKFIDGVVLASSIVEQGLLEDRR